ncbi:MAG TPA: hypothetical protein VLA14_10945 [Polyangia bacterium]|jgi:hypothetical protein|nr:hypothetical protein [Polyangia bacterium]
MNRSADQKIYQTFEEFEREELRRESYFDSGYEVIDEMFAGELDFDASSGGRSKRNDADDEE